MEANHKIKYLIDIGVVLHPNTVEMRNWILKVIKEEEKQMDMELPFFYKNIRFEKMNFENFLLFRKEMKLEPMEILTCRPVNNVKDEELENHFNKLFNNRNNFIFTILNKEDKIIGRASLFDYNSRNKTIEIGYFILKPFRRKGYGELVINGIKKICFEGLEINKIIAQTGSFNKDSIKLLEKCNFSKDGILREHHEIDGELLDDFLYSILKREYQKEIDTL